MPDKQNDREENKEQNEEPWTAPRDAFEKPAREVVVTHLDSPPHLDKKSIHPRRPAPIVPTSEQRTGERPAKDADSEEPSRK